MRERNTPLKTQAMALNDISMFFRRPPNGSTGRGGLVQAAGESDHLLEMSRTLTGRASGGVVGIDPTTRESIPLPWRQIARGDKYVEAYVRARRKAQNQNERQQYHNQKYRCKMETQVKPKLRCATWNIDSTVGNTLENLANLCKKKRLDIVALQDAKLGNVQSLSMDISEKHYVVLTKCQESGFSTGFVLRKEYKECVQLITAGFRSTLISLDMGGIFLTLVSSYAPVNRANEPWRQEYRRYLREIKKMINQHRPVGKPVATIWMGDQNAHIGKDALEDSNTWADAKSLKRILGYNLYHDKTNEAGKMLLEAMETEDLYHPQSFQNRNDRRGARETFSSGGKKTAVDYVFVDTKFKWAISTVIQQEKWKIKERHTHIATSFTIQCPQISRVLQAPQGITKMRGPVVVTHNSKDLARASWLMEQDKAKQEVTNMKVDLEMARIKAEQGTIESSDESPEELERRMAALEKRAAKEVKKAQDEIEELGYWSLINQTEKELQIQKAKNLYDGIRPVMRAEHIEWQEKVELFHKKAAEYFPLTTKKEGKSNYREEPEFIKHHREQALENTDKILRLSKMSSRIGIRDFFNTWKAAAKTLKNGRCAGTVKSGNDWHTTTDHPAVSHDRCYVEVDINQHMRERHPMMEAVNMIAKAIRDAKTERENHRKEIEDETKRRTNSFYSRVIRPVECHRTFGAKMAATWNLAKILRRGVEKVVRPKATTMEIRNPITGVLETEGEARANAFGGAIQKLFTQTPERLAREPNLEDTTLGMSIEALNDKPKNGKISKRTRSKLEEEWTIPEVILAIKGMKTGKAFGLSGIQVETVKSNPEEWAEILHPYFNGKLPSSWQKGWAAFLPKGKGDETDPEVAWRTIHILEIPYRIWARMCVRKVNMIARDIVQEFQFGFQAKMGCADAVGAAQMFIHRSTGADPCIGLIDLSKAFDMVDRGMLWNKLLEAGCPRTFVKHLKEGHENHRVAPFYAGSLGDTVKITRGVPQGSPLSPVLFLIYSTDWITRVRRGMARIEDELNVAIENKTEVISEVTHEEAIVPMTAQKMLDFIQKHEDDQEQIARRLDQSQFADDTSFFAKMIKVLAETIKLAKEEGLSEDILLNAMKTIILRRRDWKESEKIEFLTTIGLTPGTDEWNYAMENTFRQNARLLGSIINIRGHDKQAMVTRLNAAGKVYRALHYSLFSNPKAQDKLKGIAFQAIIISIATFCLEMHDLSDSVVEQLQSSINGKLLRMYKGTRNLYPNQNPNLIQNGAQANDGAIEADEAEEDIEEGDEDNHIRDVPGAAKRFKIQSIRTHLAGLNLNHTYKVLTTEGKMNGFGLLLTQKLESETREEPKNTHKIKRGSEANASATPVQTKKALSLLVDALLERQSIMRDVIVQCEGTWEGPHRPPEEADPQNEFADIDEESLRKTEREAYIWDEYSAKCLEQDYLHELKEAEESYDNEEKAKKWTYLKQWLEQFQTNENMEQWKVGQLIMKEKIKEHREKTPRWEWNGPDFETLVDLMRKTATSVAKARRERKNVLCEGCTGPVTGTSGLALHLSRAWRAYKANENRPEQLHCIEAYRTRHPVFELDEDQIGNVRRTGGDPDANEPWKREPWKFKCPVNPKSCQFPKDLSGSQWCIYCMIREDYEPKGIEKRNEKLREKKRLQSEGTAKTGDLPVPNEDPRDKAKLKAKTNCQFGLPFSRCKYPSEKKSTWCHKCNLFDKEGDKREQPWEEELLPKAL